MDQVSDIRSSPYFGLIAVAIIAAACGVIGYLIATRRIKQPVFVFLGRFGIAFFLLFILETALLITLPSFHATMQSLTARLVGSILTLAGASHSISGSTIILQSPYLSFDITASCLGGELFWTYTALVIAETTATNKQRVTGILVGLAILLVFNFFRITLSIYLEWLTGSHVHDYFYLFNMIFVLIVWAGWLWTLRRGQTRFARATP
jgi:exosortase/archaeosortase family protein